MDIDEEAPGFDAYWLGVRLTFFALVLMFIYLVAGSASRVGGVDFPLYLPAGAGDAATTLTIIAVVVVLVTAAIASVFLYLTLHGVTVVVDSGASAATLGVPPVPDGSTAGLLFLVPPAVLLYAGYRAVRAEGEVGTAVLTVVITYAVAAALGLIPAAWLFNEIVASILQDMAGTTAVGAAQAPQIVYPDPFVAHLKVAVAYPLVFGGAGAALGAALSGTAQAAGHQAD